MPFTLHESHEDTWNHSLLKEQQASIKNPTIMSYKHTHTPPHRLYHIHFFQIWKSHHVPETVIYTKNPHPSLDSPQCSLDQKGQNTFSNKTRELSWLSWCTELGPDSCFICFCLKMFLSASCVVYWSVVHDPGRTKMKTSQDDFSFLLKDLNTIRAVWSIFFSGYCSADWQNPWANEKLSQMIFPAVLYSGKAGSALHAAKLAHKAGEAEVCLPHQMLGAPHILQGGSW